MAKRLNVQLVIIDPQKDFMDILAGPGDPVEFEIPGVVKFRSTLPVSGALKDMERLSALVDRIGHKFDDIHVTLDSHHEIDVAHPGMWRDADGNEPKPFTIITHDDVANGVWSPKNPAFRGRMLRYTEELARKGNYPLMIWPVHCLIGSWGHTVEDNIFAALRRWERKNYANVDFVTKGANPFSEHYGALEAEVSDPSDPSTSLNTPFITVAQDADIIAVSGEASSHCVKETVRQFSTNIGQQHIHKFHLLTDCMSPVPQSPGGPDFPAIAQQFIRDMQSLGMTLTTSTDFLA